MLACTLWFGVNLKVLPLPQRYFCFRATDGYCLHVILFYHYCDCWKVQHMSFGICVNVASEFHFLEVSDPFLSQQDSSPLYFRKAYEALEIKDMVLNVWLCNLVEILSPVHNSDNSLRSTTHILLFCRQVLPRLPELPQYMLLMIHL
jgi:hypothetical protein